VRLVSQCGGKSCLVRGTSLSASLLSLDFAPCTTTVFLYLSKQAVIYCMSRLVIDGRLACSTCTLTCLVYCLDEQQGIGINYVRTKINSGCGCVETWDLPTPVSGNRHAPRKIRIRRRAPRYSFILRRLGHHRCTRFRLDRLNKRCNCRLS
jgi:hypothetical protein